MPGCKKMIEDEAYDLNLIHFESRIYVVFKGFKQ